MPELNGIEATRQILADLPEIKIIALSMYADKRYISGMFKAGASGYLLKKSVFDELVDIISMVMNNQHSHDPIISKTITTDYSATSYLLKKFRHGRLSLN
ncbi:MAG: response regulator transcription factor [Dissulfuribacterales bacterium]